MEAMPSLSIAAPKAEFFSVPDSKAFNKIKEFTRLYFEKEMTEMQIQILNKRIYTVITKEGNVQNLEADDYDLLVKISKVCKQLVVSSKSIWMPEVVPQTDRQYLIYNIIRGKLPPFEEIFQDSQLISSVLWLTNLELLEEARTLVQNLLADIHRQLSVPIAESDEFHLEMIMGDLLALYPFLMPQDGEMIRLPAKIDGVWQLEDYITDRIELTPEILGSPLVAYGLSPSNEKAPPLLLFKGTTYPTDEGALLSFMTDVNPLGSVGSYGFWLGMNKIQSWIDKQHSKIIVYGKSLGGALSWRTALYYPDKIAKVMAYGAPGFSPLALIWLFDVNVKYPDLQFNFFCQRNDLVPFSDCVATSGVNYYEVLSANCQDNAVAAHADMYSTHESSMILHMQQDYIRSRGKRALVTIGRLSGTLLFPLACAGMVVSVAYNTLFKK